MSVWQSNSQPRITRRSRSRRRSIDNHLNLLEPRVLLSGTLHPLDSIPALNSLPGAFAKLYLDFDGEANIYNTPAYDQDGDKTTFSDSELASIQEIWARLAEKYSPFKINVTTVNPGNENRRETLRALIGGNGSWYGGSYGGVASVGDFYNITPTNTVYVFEDNLGNGNPKYTAEATAHESGHGFGLYHQSIYSGTTLTAEYNPGNAQVAPIMGNSYSSARGLWWNGPDNNSSTEIQDDLVQISGSSNAFGYRPQDHGQTRAAADGLTITGTTLSGSGIIAQTSDTDYFSFTTPAGAVTLNVNVAQYGPMLHAKAELRDSSGAVIVTAADANTLSQTISTTLAAGTYYLAVTSFGQYGDIGQYTVTGTIPAAGGNPTPTVTLTGNAATNEGASYTLNLGAAGNLGTDTFVSFLVNWGDGTAADSYTTSGNKTHTYADGLNNYTISVSVVDSGGSHANVVTQAITINNVAPTLGISGVASINEGSLYTLNLSSADPGTDTISSWTINWGDGTAPQVVPGNPPTVTHTFAHYANVTISATATDEDGTYAAGNTRAVSVADVAPTIALTGAATTNEGALYTLALGAITDPGGSTVSSYIVNWGDGTTADTYASAGNKTHTYADGLNNYTITVTLADANGSHPGAGSLPITVNNVAPAPVISGNNSVNEGSVYTLSLSKTDPGLDTITSWTINWGDGSAAQVVPGNPPTVTHTFADNASITISATATDEDGTYSATNKTLTVNNVAPTLTLTGAATINEGSSYTLNLASSDVGPDTISSWTITWGDGTAAQVVPGNPATVTHTFAHYANITISATATDEDGTYAAGNTRAVSVADVAPTIALTGNATTNEGALYTLTLGTITDPGGSTVASYIVNWGDGTTADTYASAGNKTHTYADGLNNYTITVTLADANGNHPGAGSLPVTVNNVAPTLAISGLALIAEGSPYTLSLSSIDAGADTISSWTINWGDGTAAQVVPGNPPTVTHTFADNANITISASATDDDGTYAAGNTKAVAVTNVAPTIALTGNATTPEASVYTLALGSIADPGTDTVTSWVVYWGDGGTQTFTSGGNKTHTYADGPISYTISVSLVDEDGTHAAAGTLPVSVLNIAPTLAISGNNNAVPGTVYTLNLTSSDPGPDAISGWRIDWGDGTAALNVVGHPATAGHIYAAGGSFTISATATDEDGTYTAGNTKAVTVTATPPVMSISGAATINEGASYSLSLSTSRALNTWTINWGDGTAAQTINGTLTSASHAYADGLNSYIISAVGADAQGSYDVNNTVGVTVNNVAPTLTLSGPASISEGGLYTLSLASSDVGTDTISSWTVTWGDGTAAQVVPGSPSSITHTFARGSYAISATATDDDGTYSAGNTKAVTVADVAPTIALAGNATTPEGSLYTLTLGAITDPGGDSVTSYIINWGDGTATDTYASAGDKTHTYPDGLSHYTVSVTLVDSVGSHANAGNLAVTVNNVAPTLTLSGPTTLVEGSTYTLGLASIDPGTDIIGSWNINWGDGTTAQVITGNPSSVNHVFATSGSFTITASATDDDGSYTAAGKAITASATAPNLSIAGLANANEGASYTLGLSTNKPVDSWLINWGDGTTPQTIAGGMVSTSHAFADHGSFTISASATNTGGTYWANSLNTDIADVAPTIALTGPATVNEGSLYTLNLGAITDPGADVVTNWIVNWGDGTPLDNYTAAGNKTHTYADGPNNYTIAVALVDSAGTHTTAGTLPVSLNNVSPTLALGGAASVNEGSVYTLNLSANDPGTDTISSWRIAWGDGTAPQTITGNPSSVTHNFTRPGGYSITASATDEDGTLSAPSKAITVNDVAPTIALSGNPTVNEGAGYTLNLGTITHPVGNDVSAWIINWGDGTTADSYTSDGNKTHTYADGLNNYTISVTLVDSIGSHADAGTLPVTVSNVAPALSLSGPTSARAGSLYTLNLASIDPGTDTISSWNINWGDGSQAQIVAGHPSAVTHTFTLPGSFTISAMATDEDGAYSAGSMGLVVSNAPPVLSISGNAGVSEGSLYTLTLASNQSVQSWTIAWGDGQITSNIAGNATSASHVYADGLNAYTISASATDAQGTYGAGTLPVTVANVQPTITLQPTAALDAGSTFAVTGTFADPGADAWTGLVDWGDGTTAPLALNANKSFALNHVYAQPGTFNASVTINDDDAGVGNATTVVTVSPLFPTKSQRDSHYVRRQGQSIQVFQGDAAIGDPIYTMPVSSSQSLNFSGDVGAHTVIVDTSGGSPIPQGGMSFNGNGGNNTLRIAGGTDMLTINGSQIGLGGGADISYGGVQALDIAGIGGLSLQAAPSFDTLSITAAQINIDASTLFDGMGLVIGSSANITFNTSMNLASLTINDGATVCLTNGTGAVLKTGGLTINGTGSLDLADGGLLMPSTAANRQAMLASLTAMLNSGRNGGAWNGPGIASSIAAADPGQSTGPAMVLNNNGMGGVLMSKLGTQDADADSILIKHTRNGDSDLTGAIDGDDYFRIDRGFMTQSGGYANGDLNYDGAINADDYFLIDSAMMSQTLANQALAAPAQPAARPAQQIAKAAPIANPAISATKAANVAKKPAGKVTDSPINAKAHKAQPTHTHKPVKPTRIRHS